MEFAQADRPLIWFLTTRVMQLPATEMGNYLGAALRLALIIGLGYLFYLLFERPFANRRPASRAQLLRLPTSANITP